MAWVETVSASFRARHESRDADDADRVLDALEHTRDRLARVFPRTVGELTIVLHGSAFALALTNPLLPMGWLATDPAARRYVTGWVGNSEIHVLTPAACAARASKVAGSRQMLAAGPAALYTRCVVNANNHDLPRLPTPHRIALEFRWAWLLEGAARWFGGQIEHARPAIARRLHDGGKPSFPPGVRDAPLLGGTVIDMLVREHGEQRAVQLACRLHPDGPRAALSKAFGGRALVHTEGAWRSHLAHMAGSR